MNRILVDCDGVLSDMTGAVLRLASTEAMIFDKTEADVTCWDYGQALGWKGWREAVDRAVAQREFCWRMEPYPGAADFLRALERRHGADNVLICTSPWNAAWASQRIDWLRRYMGVPLDRVVQAKRKDVCRGFLVDDRIDHLEAHEDGVFCIARAHNATYTGPRGNYQTALDYIKEAL